MSGMDFHTVKACILCKAYGIAELYSHLPDFSITHSSHKSGGIKVEACGSGNGNLSGCAGVRHVAAVTELNGGLSSRGMDVIGECTQRHDNLGTEP